MKRLALLSPCLIGAVLAGCGSDDEYSAVDNQTPSLEMETVYHAEYGRQLTIEGAVEDLDGIQSIQLVNKDLYLNKTIDILSIYGPEKTTYDLSYNITVPDSLSIQEFPVNIIVTDLQGNMTQTVYTIVMDGDYTNPSFVSVPDDNISIVMSSYNLKFSVQDNKVVKRVVVTSEELGIDDDIDNETAKYSYANKLSITENGTYTINIKVYDAYDNVVEKTINIEKGDLKDYEKMYLSDVSDEADLTSDILGVPMLIEHTGEFTYHGEYYNRVAGTEVRFLPQKSQFAPICIGIDPDNESSLTLDPDKAQPFVLDEVSYYEFDFNISTGEYSYSTIPMSDIYSPSWDAYKDMELGVDHFLVDTDQEQPLYIILCGAGFDGYDETWNPRSWMSPQLNKDVNNPYLLTTEVSLTKGNTLEFTITASHWWGWWPEPFWRFESGDNDSKENEYNTPNGGNNMTKTTVQKSGTYEVVFDTYLLRTKIIPVND